MAVASAPTKAGATGSVIAITGPVVDVEFPQGQLPAIFNAVKVEREGGSLICEVQQHLGNNWVRSVAMTTTDGLARGAKVVDTGGPIRVPVGPATLGRVFNVLGEPIDNEGEVKADQYYPIHRAAPDVKPLLYRPVATHAWHNQGTKVSTRGKSGVYTAVQQST